MFDGTKELISLAANGFNGNGTLRIPDDAEGFVLFACAGRAYGIDFLANVLPRNGLATLLVDLLTATEYPLHENRLNLRLLADRLECIRSWSEAQPVIRDLPLGVLGLDTGAAAALNLAASPASRVQAVVSVSGRPDLAEKIRLTKAPTLLIAGENDGLIVELNRVASYRLPAESELVIIPRANHWFEQPGTLQAVAERAGDWFAEHLYSKRLGSAATPTSGARAWWDAA